MAHPTDFHSALTDARLSVVAECLLDVVFDTEMDLSSPLDDRYTRGTTTFGRSRNAIIRLCRLGTHSWLNLVHSGQDVTFQIEGVPCRFFADDPSNPRKPGFFRRNVCDQLFAMDANEPVIFRFVVDKPDSEGEEVEVFFVGYDAGWTEVLRWQHSRSAPLLMSVDTTLPPEVPMAPVQVRPRIEQPTKDKAAGDDEERQD